MTTETSKTQKVFDSVTNYIFETVKELVADKTNRDIIMTAVVTGVTATFKLTPQGFIATAIIPLMVNKAIEMYFEKEKEASAQ